MATMRFSVRQTPKCSWFFDRIRVFSRSGWMTRDVFDIHEGTVGYPTVFSLTRSPIFELKSHVTRFLMLVDRKKSFSCNLGEAIMTE